MRFKRAGKVMSVDLHGMYEADARELLLGWLSHAPAGVEELRVIHGSNQGTVLRDMVREGLDHPKIKAKLPTLNPGETRLLLKK
ncbi:MAG: Smr/MutS family protein [Acutalibacter sp.]|nr:Smr/MutS family protein [Acutalibacter sp.]